MKTISSNESAQTGLANYIVPNSTSLSHNFTQRKTLPELNSEEVLNRLPVIIFISVLIILGTAGNFHVIYIYFRKFPSSTYRIFVLTLATIDIISCFVTMPFEIYDELNPYTFKSGVACKIFRFVEFTLAIATGLMLVVIASERYRRICKSFGTQLTEKQSLYALIGVMCCASVSMLSTLYIYGTKSMKIPGYDLIGTECTWGDHLEGNYVGYIFYGATLLIVIACMVALVVIYVFVGRFIWTHASKMSSNVKKYQLREPIKLEVIEEETAEEIRKARDSFRFKKVEKTDTNGFSSTENVSLTTDKDRLKDNDTKLTKIPKNTANTNQMQTGKRKKRNEGMHNNEMRGLQKAFKDVTGRKAGVYPLLGKPEKRVSDRERRITVVLFTITVLYIVSFLPYIIILIVYSTDVSYERNMSQTEHVLYLIGLRLYLVNNIANPFLYSSFDSKFRNHLTDMYSFLTAII